MNKRILAAYDLLVYMLVLIPVFFFVTFILLVGMLAELDLRLMLGCMVALMLPTSGIFFCRFIEFRDEKMFVFNAPFPKGWFMLGHPDQRVNDDKDQTIFFSEVEALELVKLTKEELKELGQKHLFNKYLKITVGYGSPKYVYVGNYAERQIKKIVKMLTPKQE